MLILAISGGAGCSTDSSVPSSSSSTDLSTFPATTSSAYSSAASGSSLASTPSVSDKVITLTLDTQIDGDTVRASGSVNLPDGGKLSVVLNRTIFDPQEPNGPGYYGVDFAEIEVRNGRYAYDLVDERKHSATAFVTAYNQGEPPQNHQRVGENVEVTVSFSPQSEGQTNAAIEAAGGPGGANLETSPQRRQIGGWTDHPYWTLTAQREFAKPLP